MNVKSFILFLIVIFAISVFLVSCAPPKTGRATASPTSTVTVTATVAAK